MTKQLLTPYKRKYDNEYRVTSSALKEGVIYPDNYIKDIEKKINTERFNNLIITSDNLNKLCKRLSVIFWFNNIKFIPENTPKGIDKMVIYGLNGGGTLSDKNNTIFIKLNNNSLMREKNIVHYKMFCKMLVNLIKHELIHRGQKLFIKNKELKQKIYDTSVFDSDKKYYSNKYEIMAHAFTIIEDLKLLGNLETERIRDTIKRNDIGSLMFLGGISYAFHQYTTLFDMNSKEIKLLYKYIFMYLNEEK